MDNTIVVDSPVEVNTPIKTRKPRRITFKQKMFVEEYIKSKGKGKQSAMKVYDVKNGHVAENISAENLGKPVIIEEIARGFEKAGLTKQKVFELHSEGMLKAIKQGQPRMSDGFKGLDMFYKLTNMYPNNIKKSQHESIKYVFDGKDDKELKELIKARLHVADNLTNE
jgi:phage terminase small subunit